MIKALDAATNEPVDLVFNDHGVLLSDHGEATLRAESERRAELVGTLNDELWETALSTDDATRIPTYVWLRVYEPVHDRFALSADPSLNDAWEAESRHVRELTRQQLENDLPYITDSLRFEPGAPIAYGELLPEEIFEIADHPFVAEIGLDKPSEPTWTSYVDTDVSGIFSSTGAQQKVCIIEPAPVTTPNTSRSRGLIAAAALRTHMAAL